MPFKILAFMLLFMGIAHAQQHPVLTPLKPGEFALHMHPDWPGFSMQDIEKASKIGAKVIRIDLPWKDTEPTPGIYEWKQYDEILAEMKRRGIRPLLILGKNNLKYSQPDRLYAEPHTPTAREGYANWATAALLHFEKYDPIYELWNEPDNPRFWRPRPNSADYLALADAACEAMRKQSPAAAIIGPGLSVIPSRENRYHSANYLQDLFEDKAFTSCLTAFSVHPYRSTTPESFLFELPMLADNFNKAQPNALMPPLVVSEWGYSTYKAGGLTREKQAIFAVRQQLMAILMGHPFSVAYGWRDEGTNPNDKEHNFGMFTFDNQPKPYFEALKTFNSQLEGFTFTGRLPSPQHTYILAFKHPRTKALRYVAWSSVKPQLINTPIPRGYNKNPKPTVTDLTGHTYNLKVSDTTILPVAADFSPIYITLKPTKY